MSSVEQISNRLQELVSFIENAQEQLSGGQVVNLSHLDDEVAEICEHTLQLKPEEAAQIQPVMADMITKLEELGIALQQFQANLKDKNGIQ